MFQDPGQPTHPAAGARCSKIRLCRDPGTVSEKGVTAKHLFSRGMRKSGNVLHAAPHSVLPHLLLPFLPTTHFARRSWIRHHVKDTALGRRDPRKAKAGVGAQTALPLESRASSQGSARKGGRRTSAGPEASARAEAETRTGTAGSFRGLIFQASGKALGPSKRRKASPRSGRLGLWQR